MINLMLGQPGGGKSYEATVFHVLPAIMAGRKVITNLPLDLTRWAALYPDKVHLIEVRTQSHQSGFRVFAHESDYADPWRHPENGSGPLYVIDEAHKFIPRGSTRPAVDEWYAEHRHEFADVLLMTQSYGKLSKPIVELVQVVYRVKKAIAFGFSSKYVRKVQDGVRGEVISEEFRNYEKRYFGLYKSHTRSGAGVELGVSDVKPLWRRWPFLAAPVVIIGGCAWGASELRHGIFDDARKSQRVVSHQVVAPPAAAPTSPVGPTGEVAPAPKPAVETGPAEPFTGMQVHVVGSAFMGDRWLYTLALSRNGNVMSRIDHNELKAAGYEIRKISDCAMAYTWPGQAEKIAVCDVPSVGVAVLGS